MRGNFRSPEQTLDFMRVGIVRLKQKMFPHVAYLWHEARGVYDIVPNRGKKLNAIQNVRRFGVKLAIAEMNYRDELGIKYDLFNLSLTPRQSLAG